MSSTSSPRCNHQFCVATPAGLAANGTASSSPANITVSNTASVRALTAADVMFPRPKLVRADALAVDAADLMEQHRITSVLVVDAGGRLVGALNSNDLMRAKVI